MRSWNVDAGEPLAGVGIPAADAGSAPLGDPEHPFRVDGQSVGKTLALSEAQNGARRCDVSGIRIEIVSADGPGGGVDVVECAGVGAPGQAIGDSDAFGHAVCGAISIDAVERADGIFLGEIHRACPETALRVALPVIESGGGPGIDGGQAFEPAGWQVQEGHSIFEGDEESALVPGDDGSDAFLEPGDGRVFSAAGVEAADARAEDIDPIKNAFAGVPTRAFAEPGLGLGKAFKGRRLAHG